MNLIDFFISRLNTILDLTWEHLLMVLIAMAISIILGVLLGVLITYNEKASRLVLNVAEILMTIPSLALFAVLIPIFHIGATPAIIGLVLYTQLPIIRNVYTGIKSINPSIIESAKGMGMSDFKIMYKIKLPLAFSVLIAGVRTAVVMGVGMGAIASYVGAGGLGDYIFQGIQRTNDKMVIIGAIMISLMAIIMDRVLYIVQKKVEVK
ncbi:MULTISPECIES: ABC transporter permease [unclassified Sedimentibacter]|uniref:ABC transporter permease n=1 Tax=unclassified Sedimentibacter TaxID=2649220 RepID=UPI0027E1239B|nr:ABC transporter permease [Sedimentibacter sp. MB35-C1]WMJ77827.1 ABC transporter permease [Sedimentibacter sp. MB35-C1]